MHYKCVDAFTVLFYIFINLKYYWNISFGPPDSSFSYSGTSENTWIEMTAHLHVKTLFYSEKVSCNIAKKSDIT